LTQADFDRARLRVNGKDASRAEWQTAVRVYIGKQRMTARFSSNAPPERNSRPSSTGNSISASLALNDNMDRRIMMFFLG
jgi:hypothetical protein